MKKIRIGFMICAMLCLLVGCSKGDQSEENFVPTFLDKYSVREMDNGWVYFLVINYEHKDDDEMFNISFDGRNIKYKSIEGIKGVPIVDEDGNAITYINKAMPDLSIYSAELKNIHDFLTEKKYTRTITTDDLNGLETRHIDKNLLVEMYNEALTSNSTFGKYGKFSDTCLQKKDADGNIIQLSYVNLYGNLVAYNVEFIYTDGTYLSDYKDSSSKEIQAKIDAYEDEVLKSQDIQTKHSFTEIKGLDKGLDVIIKEEFLTEKTK